MTATLAPIPFLRFTSTSTGLALVGGQVSTFAAGTTTPQATYTDSTGGTPNTNPIVLNSRGECICYLDPSLTYKFVVKDSLGNTISTYDNLSGSDTVLRSALVASGGSALVGFLQAGTGAVSRLAQDKMRDVVSVKDFGAVGDGSTNDTAAIQAALNSVPLGSTNSKTIYFPTGLYLITSGLTAAGRAVILRGDGPRSSMLVVAAGVTAMAFNATGCPAACIGMMNMGVVESGTQIAMIGLTARNTGDFFLQNIYITTSGKALDIGSSAGDVTFTLMSQVRIECFGGQEAIRFRCGGGNWSNVYARKFRTAGVVGPTLYISGQVTSLTVSNCVFSGKGTPRQTKINSIVDGGAVFTISATNNLFAIGETFVIRGTGTSYDNQTWKIATAPDANTLTVNATTGFGNVTPANATVDKLHATVYMNNEAGAVNESMWSNVLFEGIDDGGSAGGTGSVSLYVDACSGVTAISSHQFSNCLYDAGQTSVYLGGKNIGGGDYCITDFRFNGAVCRYVKNGFYMKEVRGVFISDAAGDCLRPNGTAAELLNSAYVWIDGNGFQAPIGICISDSTLGRQAGFGPNAIGSFSADYGLRLGGAPQNIRLSNSHIFGLTGSVLIDGASVLPVDTRLMDNGCTYASGAGGETSATRIPTVASATSITLPLGDTFIISGTTTITTMLNGWVGRKVFFITGAAVTFNTGGNIANALTTGAGQLVAAVFDSANWHLR
ncbi:glycosyl hydrolase family 28-related protein [Ramlibacter sp.]|uniref:glycosyl hydrolase family 28-related protein n=1 Tax=Ramlibacter sp. TaxID=1917967 RepID=UPI00262EB9F8|nr:glycosyl hydrolase family 28-related protein [Ramlibacter sp.]MDB5956736.1 hypothetical protein [Ramlibacter sp.]